MSVKHALACIARPLLLTVFAALSLVAQSYAAPTTFFGLDANPNDPLPLADHPNSDAARNSFVANLQAGSVGFQSFESFSSVVTFSPLGVTATLSGPFEFGRGNHPGGLFPISGDGYIQSFAPASIPRTFLSMTFSSPQTAFGFYGIDFEDFFGFPDPGGSIQVQLSGGGSTSVFNVFDGISAADVKSGAVHFWGVIDAEHPFTTVSLIAPAGAGWVGEGIAIDDVYIGTPASIPEPTTLALLALGLCAIWCVRKPIHSRTNRP